MYTNPTEYGNRVFGRKDCRREVTHYMKRTMSRGSMVVCVAVWSALSALAQTGPEVSLDIQHDVSPPLRNTPSLPLRAIRDEKPLRLTHPNGPVPPHQQDPVVQTSAGPLVATTPGLNFAGVGNGDYGFAPDAAPPDTNGAVGATQFVQWVNESFAVFDKATGAIAPGFPKAGNTLWSGFGGGCETNNDGDPIVQYDKANNRWIFTQFSVSTKPYLQCVAVSTTSDATGTFNRYAFSYGSTQFPDYPKLAVWPDAYYISFNIFAPSFIGPKACAYDGAAMRAGTPATQVCFQLSNSFGSLLPSDLDGSTAPPAGSPNFFLSFGTNSLNLWKFHVDFVTPANSTLTGPTNMPVAAFTRACGGGTCIPQLGTSQQLDSLGDRLMYRLAYRNFGDHEAMVVNHSVTAGSSVGIRWYEIRNPGGTPPTVYQQSTFAPDSSYRWMGSIAMDQAGNIAMGYSVSSSAINPAIRYTGRAPGDALGTMQAENVIIGGAGSQTGGLKRWGDYSSISIDPVDDCTFWYTNEYLKATGSFNWSTWIASFKFPGCGGPPPPPLAPTLSATAGNAQVSLSWTTSAGATSYNVYRSTTSGGPYGPPVPVATTSYTDTTVSNGTTYFYIVKAVNANGQSGPSNEASATPTAPTKPAPPASLTATPGNAQVGLSWPASAGATSYNVYRSTTSGGPYGAPVPVGATVYTDSTVSNGTTYFYVVTAVNGAGESGFSPEASATPTGPSGPPAAPNSLTATPGPGAKQISLSWTASSGATSYNVKRSSSSGGPYTTVATGVTATSYTNGGLTRGATYYFVVSAVNSSGESPNSNQASATAR